MLTVGQNHVAAVTPAYTFNGPDLLLVLALLALVVWAIWREFHPRGWLDEPVPYKPTEPTAASSAQPAATTCSTAPPARLGRQP